ncbi:MAG: hypothetical protein IJZ74_10510, partial [Clostridia bacterium]|nr:hypothetical protein [Clostridia bacterium]
KAIGEWLISAVVDKANSQLDEIKDMLTAQQQQLIALHDTVESKHAEDPVAKECDLAILDDRICYLIGKCREKGYTTAEDRRRVGRMHDAYKARGGNHGEENEYAIFCDLMTEEEYRRYCHD